MVNYGLKDVPKVIITLIDKDRAIYTIMLNCIHYYEKTFSTTRGHIIKLTATLLNPKDLIVLLSKKYDKYIIEASRYWRNSETLEDELFEEPAVSCTDFQVNYNTSYSGNPADFNMTFWEKRNEY